MKKLIFFSFLFLALLNEFSLATNPADTNWRSYIFDKQAWGMGPINNIIIIQK